MELLHHQRVFVLISWCSVKKLQPISISFEEFINWTKHIIKFSFSTLFQFALKLILVTAQKWKFSIKDFFSKCDQIHRKLRIWSHLLKKSLMENFIFCAVSFWSVSASLFLFVLLIEKCMICYELVILRFFRILREIKSFKK